MHPKARGTEHKVQIPCKAKADLSHEGKSRQLCCLLRKTRNETKVRQGRLEQGRNIDSCPLLVRFRQVRGQGRKSKAPAMDERSCEPQSASIGFNQKRINQLVFICCYAFHPAVCTVTGKAETKEWKSGQHDFAEAILVTDGA
eukprot:32077_6